MTDLSALELWERAPRHFINGVRQFVYKAFGDGHHAAASAALVTQLGPAPTGHGASFVVAGDAALPMDVPITKLQRDVEELVSSASKVIDDAACRDVTWALQLPTWSEAIQSGLGLLGRDIIWLAPVGLRDALHEDIRRMAVDMPGRGRQPDARLGESSLFFCDLQQVDRMYAFAPKAGKLYFPEPLAVDVEIEDGELKLTFSRNGTAVLDETRRAAEYRLGS